MRQSKCKMHTEWCCYTWSGQTRCSTHVIFFLILKSMILRKSLNCNFKTTRHTPPLLRLCSALYWRRPASVRRRSSPPCWPASVWGTTPRPSGPASGSPETSDSSAPGRHQTQTQKWVRRPQNDPCVWGGRGGRKTKTHIHERSRRRAVGKLLHFTNVLPALTEQTGPGAQTPQC